MWLFHYLVQTWYVPSKNSFHDLEKRKLEIKKIWSKWTIFLNVPLKKCFSGPWKYLLVVWVCSSSTYFGYDPQFPDLGQRAQIPVKYTCKNEKFIIGMKLYLVVLNCFFRKKNLVWNTSILPLDVQSTIGLWKDSNFSPILSASWIVFY